MRTLLNPWSRLETAFGSGTCKEHLNEQANENSTTCRNRIGGCLCAADSCGNRGGADGPVPDLRQGKDHQRDRGGYGRQSRSRGVFVRLEAAPRRCDRLRDSRRRAGGGGSPPARGSCGKRPSAVRSRYARTCSVLTAPP